MLIWLIFCSEPKNVMPLLKLFIFHRSGSVKWLLDTFQHCYVVVKGLKDDFIQKLKLSHYLLTLMLKESFLENCEETGGFFFFFFNVNKQPNHHFTIPSKKKPKKKNKKGCIQLTHYDLSI